MSRVGKRPIHVPDDVDIDIAGHTVTASGPHGELAETVSAVVGLELSGDELLVTRPDDTRQSRSHHGLARSILSNMVEGVAEGYTQKLEIHGVGYRAEKHGRYIRFDLGFSHPVLLELPALVDVTIDDQTEVELTGPAKELLGQIAAKIRGLRPPEPYKGKGIRYKGERIIRKVGKAGAA